jgi:hypothetical protein
MGGQHVEKTPAAQAENGLFFRRAQFRFFTAKNA